MLDKLKYLLNHILVFTQRPFTLHTIILNIDDNPLLTPVTSSSTSGMKLGGFPVRLLLMITRLNKILNIKRESVAKLSIMNGQAEAFLANGEPLTRLFQTSYAQLVLDLEKLNKDLVEYLNGVQKFSGELKGGAYIVMTLIKL